jgi:hypothetical protein
VARVVAARLQQHRSSRVAGIARRRQRRRAAGRRRVSTAEIGGNAAEVVAAWQWRGQHGRGFAATATAVPARQQGGSNHRGQKARRPAAMTAMDSVTVTQWRQKARRRCNGDGNSDDSNGDSDEDGGDGWHAGDGRRYGNTTETAAMGGATAHNRGILISAQIYLSTSLSICSSQLILV